MYSGQQKLATSSCTPPVLPPPADRPKPCPRVPVSVRVTPGRGSSSTFGFAGGRRRVSVGTTFSAGFGGGGIGLGIASGGGGATSLPPSIVAPVRGPTGPARLIVMTVRGASASTPQSNGPNSSPPTKTMWAITEPTSSVLKGSCRCRRATMTSVTSVIVLLATP